MLDVIDLFGEPHLLFHGCDAAICTRGRDSHIGTGSELGGSLQRGWGEAAFVVRLDPPGDAAQEVLLVAAAARLVEDGFVPAGELVDRQVSHASPRW